MILTQWRAISLPCGTPTAREWPPRRATVRCSSAGSGAWRRYSEQSIPRQSPGARANRSARQQLRRLQPDIPHPRFNAYSLDFPKRLSRSRKGSARTMLWLALALTAAPVATAAKDKTQADSPPPQMQKLLQNCDAHKFETIVEVTLNGQVKHSRVKLCGTEGQSDAEWIKTLEDAVAKTSASLQMPSAVRDQIVAALKTEIVRLKGGGAAAVLRSLPPPRATTKTSALDGLAV